LQLGGPPGVVAEGIDRFTQVDLRFAQRLAVVHHLDAYELLLASLQRVAHAPEQQAALRRVHVTPFRILERGARGGYGPVDILCIARRDFRDQLTISGVIRREGAAGGRVDPLVVDEQLIGCASLDREPPGFRVHERPILACRQATLSRANEFIEHTCMSRS
jgi:hypothetical protein